MEIKPSWKDAVRQDVKEMYEREEQLKRGPAPGPTGDPRFHALLKQLGELHDKKQADYGKEGDPFANVRASSEWGLAPWVGALVRANDKMARLKQFAKRGALANESAEDSMMDLAVYALIALILYRESNPPFNWGVVSPELLGMRGPLPEDEGGA